MVLEGLDHSLTQKIEVFMCNVTKPQYCYKQASISCFINHGLQMLTASVLIVLFEPLGNDFDPR